MSDVSLRVKRGTIHALIGPNGAGKTTCFNMLTKFIAPTGGRITFNGRDITSLRPADVARLGLVRSFQISAVFPHLTAFENIRIALQRKRGDSFDFWRSKAALEPLNQRALALLDDVGLTSFANSKAGEISYGRKRALELATTLAVEPEMLLLDEPMAGMGHEDIDRTAELIRRVSANRTILMVEHNLKVVANLSRSHHRADARARSGGGRLSRGVGERGGEAGLYGSGEWLRRRSLRRRRRAGRLCSASKACRPGTTNRTFFTGSISTCGRARSSPCSDATGPARRRP